GRERGVRGRRGSAAEGFGQGGQRPRDPLPLRCRTDESRKPLSCQGGIGALAARLPEVRTAPGGVEAACGIEGRPGFPVMNPSAQRAAEPLHSLLEALGGGFWSSSSARRSSGSSITIRLSSGSSLSSCSISLSLVGIGTSFSLTYFQT